MDQCSEKWTLKSQKAAKVEVEQEREVYYSKLLSGESKRESIYTAGNMGGRGSFSHPQRRKLFPEDFRPRIWSTYNQFIKLTADIGVVYQFYINSTKSSVGILYEISILSKVQ